MKVKACVVNGKKDVVIVSREVSPPVKDEIQVKVTRGGLCGSDIHYYQEGRVGNFEIKSPMILGHEVIGENNDGDKIAINPSKPCNSCEYCLSGKQNQCLKMRFFGSAMLNPHVDGGFSQRINVRKDQCIKYKASCSEEKMTFAEPLAVAIHAVNQSGGVLGKRVLITGAGPIGALILAACKASGATTITVSDISNNALGSAMKMGANATINPIEDDLSVFTQEKGAFDVAFEASGASCALDFCLDATKACGTIVLVGMTPNAIGLPLSKFLCKEIKLVGSFRFTSEFETAVRWLENDRVDPLPLLTKTFELDDIIAALELASDKSQASKIQITL
ncbi:TPA: alcohol dehydrogenase catalytic domain-containing protein [Aeromonas veronii]|nr:alcohol dehydrogenase catalytic domain-containing protein [Aeromonas veronii]